MGARFSRANVLQDWAGRLHASAAAMKSANSDLQFLAEEGAQNMQHMIATRPTQTEWAHEMGRTGRVDTEEMLTAVEARPNPHASPLVFSWEFGWVETFQKYFTYQEKGFFNVWKNAMVEPMFALRDASTEARDRLSIVGTEIYRKAANLIRGGR